MGGILSLIVAFMDLDVPLVSPTSLVMAFEPLIIPSKAEVVPGLSVASSWACMSLTEGSVIPASF